MNFRQLETFYWAFVLGSFKAVAERLNTTQSTISMRIQELEFDFGVTLFDRTKRKAVITNKGKDLIPYVESLLNTVSEMKYIIGTPENANGKIRIGVVEMVSLTWLPKLIKVLHDCYPKIIFELDEALTEDVISRFCSGSLDLIFVPGTISGTDYLSCSLGLVDFQWMASPTLCSVSHRITPLELEQWPIVSLSDKSFHFSRIKDWFAAGKGTYRQDYTCKTVSVAHSLAINGLGVALLPVKQYQQDLISKKLMIIEIQPPMPSVEFFTITQKKNLNPIIRRVAEIAESVSEFEKIF